MSHQHPHSTIRVPTPRHCHQCGTKLTLKNIKKGEPDRHVCEACGEIHWLEPKLAAGALISYQGGLVMLRRDIDPGRGKWVFPGGFVDRGESLEQAAIREAREEAHVKITGLELLGAFSYPGHPVILIAYAAEMAADSPEPAAGDEATACEIWPLDRVRWDDLAFRSTQDAVRAYVTRRAKI